MADKFETSSDDFGINASQSMLPQTPPASNQATAELPSQVGMLMSQLNVLLTSLNQNISSSSSVAHVPTELNKTSEPVAKDSQYQNRVTPKAENYDLKQYASPNSVERGQECESGCKLALNIKHLPKFTETISDEESFVS